MATETLNIQGISASDSGDFSGAVTDIDEAISAADGSFMSSSADGEGETLRVTLTNPGTITDAHVVTNVSVTLRCRSDSGTGRDSVDVELFIGGTSQGSANSGIITGSFANYSGINNAGWNSDWTEAQLDGAELLFTCAQSGKAVAGQWDIDCADVIVTYNVGPETRIVHYRFALDNNPGSTTGFSHESDTDFPLQGTEDSAFTPDLDTTYALILKLANTGDSITQGIHQLQFQLDSGSWTDIGTATTGVKMVGGSDDDGATSATERLTTSARTFTQSRYEDTAGNLSKTLNADEELEGYWSIQFVDGELSGVSEVHFRTQDDTDDLISILDVTPTATLAVANDLAASVAQALSVTPGISATGDLAAAVAQALSVTPGISATGDLAAAVAQALSVTAALDASGDLAAVLAAQLTTTAAPDALGDLAASVPQALTVVPGISAEGDLAASVAQALSVTAAMTGTGDLAAALTSLLTVTAAIAANNDLAASVAQTLTVAAAMTATGDLAAAVPLVLSVVANITDAGGSNDLAAVVAMALSTTPGLSGAGDLAAAVPASLSVAAALNATGDLAAALSATLAVVAAITAEGELTAGQAIVLSVAADLSATGDLAAAVPLSLAVVADLTSNNNLAANVNLALSIAAAVDAPGTLSASVPQILSLAAAITDGNAGAVAAFAARRHIAPFIN